MVKKHEGENHRGDARAAPYGLSRLAPEISLVDVAREIQCADSMIGETTSSKLRLIAQQINLLQQQARTILDRAHHDLRLHRAACSFTRSPGQIYHLYERSSGALYWSILSPQDWHGRPPHPHRGSYRLQPDQSWTPLDEIDDGDHLDPLAADRIVAKLLPR